jgi:biopolymer transport protein ExbD
MNWVVRLDVIVLALMFTGVVVVVTRVSYRYLVARPGREIDSASRRKLASVLSIELGSLKAIASGAPYLGLAGACVGIMSSLGFGGAMEKNTFLTMVAANMAASLATTATTAAGILVAVPATSSYNYLCTCKALLESESSSGLPAQMSRYRHGTGRFPLTKRFSQLPTFALIAAPGLAVLVSVYMPYFAPREPTGFGVELAPPCCENCAPNDRITLLRITDAGKLLLNEEHEDWNSLAGRLSEIYGVREQRTLDLVADDGVPFQTVADALDIVENVAVTAGTQAAGTEPGKLDITVRLITSRALKARCPESVVRFHHSSKVVVAKSR